MKGSKTQKSLKLLSTNLKIRLFMGLWMVLNGLILFPLHAQVHPPVPSVLTLPSGCRLGEGAFWDSQRNCLWFVDIESGKVHRYIPSSKTETRFDCGIRIGTLVPASLSEELILGLQDGIYSVSLDGKTKKKIHQPATLSSDQRLNDGKCDPQGRLWVGSMNLDQRPKQAHLYRLDHTGYSENVLDSVSISNGVVWTKDGKTMYYIDTPTRKVMAFDFNGTTGAISNPRVHCITPDSLGWPDGMTLDENDDLWIGMWGGYCVSHWSGKTGQYLGKVAVAAPNVTSCAFGGEKFDILYITSAREGLGQDLLQKFPLSGNVFEAKPGVKGRQMPYWKSK